MITKTFIEVTPGGVAKIEYEGKTYDIRVQDYSNVGGYARVMVIDCDTDEHYFSDGYLELNNHIITTKWGTEFSAYRDNYICSKDLIVTIT